MLLHESGLIVNIMDLDETKIFLQNNINSVIQRCVVVKKHVEEITDLEA